MIAHLRKMEKRGFLEADIHECAEIDDVLDLAGDRHALFQVLERKHALLHDRLRIAVAGIAVRFFQLVYDIRDCLVAELEFFLEL